MREESKNKIRFVLPLILCIVIVLPTFLISFNRSWIFYDEILIKDELVAPIPSSFNELIEIIKNFGFVSNISSSNFLYSSNSVNRTNLFGVPFLMGLGLLFKKNPIYYHCLIIFLHMLNLSLVYLILRRKLINTSTSILILLASLWGIHPVQIESVFLTTNVGAILSYSFFLFIFYDFLKNRDKNFSFLRICFLSLLYLTPMLLNEYIIMLPLILLSYSFIESLTKNQSIKTSIFASTKECTPYLLGLIVFFIYFTFSNVIFFHTYSSKNLAIALERIFWLSPQIIFHNLKLIFFPKILSIDQSQFVVFGNSIFDPLSMVKIVFIIFIFILPVYLFLRQKKNPNLTILITLFFLSMLPFSQILSQTYCISAERYLYIPLFFIIFGLGLLIDFYKPNNNKLIFFLLLILISSGIRSNVRAKEWKDDFTLLKSAIKSSTNNLYKANRIRTLFENDFKEKKQISNENIKYFNLSEKLFLETLKDLEKKSMEYPNQPEIIKAYGLDYKSLITKAIYYISFRSIFFNTKSQTDDLLLFKNNIDKFDFFNPDTLELYANLLINSGKTEEGKKVFLYAYNKFPTSPMILISLIRLEREEYKNFEASNYYLLKALNLYPYSKEILFEALRSSQLSNDLLKYSRFSYLYALRTHKYEFYNEALTGYLILNDLASCEKIVQKLLFVGSNSPTSLYLLSSYYIKIKQFLLAENLLKKANQLLLNTDEVLLKQKVAKSLIEILFINGKYEEGIYLAKDSLSQLVLNKEEINSLFKKFNINNL